MGPVPSDAAPSDAAPSDAAPADAAPTDTGGHRVVVIGSGATAVTLVPALAEKAAMSERSLQRRFKAATGHSPNAYVQAVRIEKARADALITQLRGSGLPAFSEQVSSQAGTVYKVRLGPEISRDQAVELAARVKREHGLDGFVTTSE